MLGLVDPVRTSKAYYRELQRRQIDFVTIESGLVGALPELSGPIIRGTPTIEEMAQAVRALGVTRLIGCVDPSIVYTDELSAQVGLPSNGLRLAKARRNKALMNQTVAQAGLTVPLQLETDELDELLCWVSAPELRASPVVVKPVNSGGTDNVYLCRSVDDVRAAFAKIHNTRNLMGAMNSTVLAQEFVDGIEYVIDCVSFDGAHVPIDFFEYQKGTHNGRAFIYEKERFLHVDDARCLRLKEFAVRALDALEFRHGPSHMEVKINPRGEIVFIEVGPRLNGGDIHLLVRDTRADGKSQLDYTLDEAVGECAPPSPTYQTRQNGVRVYVVSSVEGMLSAIQHLDAIEALPSYKRAGLHVRVGSPVQKTTDMTNDAGWIDLVNADAEVLKRDEQTLDEILKGQVLVVEPQR
ncbi:ATP-grasp domain-containing protein [Mycolicibacterium boenickei]